MPVRDVVITIVGRDAASPAFTKAGAAAEGAAARMSRAGDRMVATGSKLTHTLTLPLLAIGVAAVKSATDFNASMTRIQTQAGASARDVQFLTRQVLAMGNVQQGPNELASALYHLKSVGLDNRQAMIGLRQGMDLANVGGANLEDTVNALAGAWRTGIRGAKDFHQAAATINAIIGAGNMRLPDLLGALGTGILPTAKTFGLTLKDVGSALALFTDEGVPADAAATRLRMSFSLLAAPSGVAAKYLSMIGLNGLQLGRDMRKPNGLIAAIGDLKAHLTDPQYHLSLVQQSDLLSRAFGGGRSSSAILSMVNNFDVLKKKQDQVTASLSKYDHAVKVQQATPQAQFKERIAEFEKAGVILGRDLLPAATAAAGEISKLAEGFNHLSPAARGIVIDVAKVAVVLGPLLVVGGKLVKMFATLGGAAKTATLFMSAPYRQAALDSELVTQQVQVNQMQAQLAEERTAAVFAVAEADKANATAESAVRIAASLEGTSSILAADSTAAAENAIDFAAAQQLKADAAVKAAAETDVALTAQTNALNAQLTGVTASAYKMQTAMAGLGIGLTVGTFTRGASTSTKLLSSLGAAAGGAAIGFSMGGPLGAAIGGLGAGLTSLATQFIGVGDAASGMSDQVRQAAQAAIEWTSEQKQATFELHNALAMVNGDYNKQYRLQIIRQLSDKGVLTGARKAGLSLPEVVKVAEGTATNKQLNDVYQGLLRARSAGRITNAEMHRLSDALLLVSSASADAQRNLIIEALAAGHGIIANKDLGNSLKDLRGVFAGYIRTLNTMTGMGVRNREAIHEEIGPINAAAKAQLNHGVAVGVVAAKYEQQIGALEQNLVKLGFNRKAVDNLIGSYGKVPKKVATYLSMRGVLPADIQAIIDKYNLVPKHVDTDITVYTGEAMSAIANVTSALLGIPVPVITLPTVPGRPKKTHPHAAGGFVADGFFTAGEAGYEVGYKRGPHVEMFSHPDSVAMTGMDRIPGYANGTGGPVSRHSGAPMSVTVRVYVGDREITDIVRVEVDDALGYEAHTGRMHGR